jgi:hypothetical protein
VGKNVFELAMPRTPFNGSEPAADHIITKLSFPALEKLDYSTSTPHRLN